MRLIAIRHGETTWNLEGRDQGQLDSPLTPTGIVQAKAIAKRLRGVAIDRFYSSDLGRAVQTAEIIAAETGRSFALDPGLRERHFGIFQGFTRAEMAVRFPAEFAEYQRRGYSYDVPGGESGRERHERSLRVLTTLAERHPDETVLVVTHGGFLMSFFEQVMGMSPGNGWRFKRQNASFNSFEHADGRWTLNSWNDVSHLDDVRALDDPTVQAALE